jgi:hypothetical protein
MGMAAAKTAAVKTAKPKDSKDISRAPGTGDKIIEVFDKSAAAQALDRTLALDARVTRLEQLMKAAAEGSYMIKKEMRKLDGE